MLKELIKVPEKIKVIVLLGPTAVGKSALSMKLASVYNCEIISCDSRQIYRGMDIGTAKMTKLMRCGIPHWLIDIINPEEDYSAFRFAREAKSIIREVHSRGKRVLLCGGTGLYFKALAEGGTPLVESDPIERAKLVEFVERNGSKALHERLNNVDPKTADRLHPNDRQRIIRAFAVYKQTGKPLSSFPSESLPPDDMEFNVFRLSIPREVLYQRINARVLEMISNGLYEEFKKLREMGYDAASPGMRTVGYRELFSVENNTCNMDDAIRMIQRSTRRYAKRQMTWFSTQTDGITIDANEQPGCLLKKIENGFR